MAKKMRTATVRESALITAVALLSSCSSFRQSSGHETPLITTEYEAILLDNTSAFFGKVSQITPDDMVLTDVYYVQSRTNPETKQVSNVLIKRGSEWHGPDRMVINRHHIVLREPVAPGSTVSKLIAQAKAGT
jgi:hypothetical protein